MKSLLYLLLGVVIALAVPIPAMATDVCTTDTLQITSSYPSQTLQLVTPQTYQSQRLRIEVAPGGYTERLVQRIETPVLYEQTYVTPLRVQSYPLAYTAPTKLQIVNQPQVLRVEAIQPNVVQVRTYAQPQQVLQLAGHQRQQVLQLNVQQNHHHRQQIVVQQQRQRQQVLQLNVQDHHHSGGSGGNLSVRQRSSILGGSRTTIRNR